MSKDEAEGVEASGESKEESKFSGVRRMVEEIVVTPFFRRHSSHMPATIKKKADILEKDDCVILKTEVPGFGDDEVDVSATENSIHIRLLSEKPDAKQTGGERSHENEVALHSSYVTPTLIDPDNIKVSRKGDVLEIRAPKKKYI